MTRPSPWQALMVLALTVIVAACGESASSVSPSQPTPTRDATAPPSSPTPETSPTATATVASTPGTVALGGTWLRPKAGARLTSYSITLSARPTASGLGSTTFTSVVFSASWAGGEPTVVCRAKGPDANDAWSCKANLLARGVPPGRVTFGFDVHGEGAPTARAPDGTRKVSYAVGPPRPTGVRWEQLTEPDLEHGDGTALHRVRWSAPAGYADEFLVYETWECPVPSTRQNSGRPCFVAGTPVDLSLLELRATASGDARSVKVRLDESECGPSHGTILLRARNAHGGSYFAIVESAQVLWVPPNVTVC